MKTTRSSAVIGVLALAGALALAVTRPRPVVLVRQAVDEAALGLDPTPTLWPIPLPVTFDEVRFDLDGGPIEVELWADGEPVSARAAHTGDLARMLGFGHHCRIDEALVARCEEMGVISLCGNRPFPGPLASADPDRFTRWHYMGAGDGRLIDQRGGELETPYGPDAAMALDEGVLLVADDASSRLRGHLLPATWGGALDHGVDLGPTRTRGAFGRCDLGEVRALHASSGEVLIGAGSRWSRYETAQDGVELGLWSCHEGALHRVDVDDAALHVVACRAAGCATTAVPLAPELVLAIDAVHLGGSVAILFTDARGLRLAMLGADRFTPSQPVGWRASLSRPSGEPSLLLHEEQLYAGITTIAGPAVLVIDATGEARWVRAPPAPPATFVGAELVPLDEDIELVRSRLDAPFRLTHADSVDDDGRACSLRPTLATDLSFRCTARTDGPLWPMIEPGATELVGSVDGYVDGGAAWLVEPDGIDDGRLDTRTLRSRGFDATAFADGRVLGAVEVTYGPDAVIEQRDGAITGCIVPYPPGPPSRIVPLDDVLGAVRFVPGDLLALSVDGARVLRLDLGEPLPASGLAGASGGEECEHLAELTVLATLPEPAREISVCPLDHALSWQATWTDRGDLLTSALGVSSAAGWAVHPLSPARRATVGCLGEAVSVLSVEGERVTALRCTASCVEERALVPGLRPGALALDLGDRLALLEVRQDGALVGRFGALASLAGAPVVELVDAAGAFVPIGTAGIDVRPGLALVLGRTPSGYAVLRVGSDGRAVPVPLEHRLGTVEVGEVLRIDP